MGAKVSGKERGIKFSNEDTIAAIITPPGEGGIGAIRIAGPESSSIISSIFRPAEQSVTPPLPFHLYYGHIVDKGGNVIDEVTMVEMPEGKSYTGQKQAEIFCHGGQFVLRQILNLVFAHGARPAEPGEFTRRAFLAGRIDLARAEAVADLIASKTEYAYAAAKNNLLGALSEQVGQIRNQALDLLSEIEASVDYPEEDIDTADKERLLVSLDKIIEEITELATTYRSGRIIKEGYKIAIAGRPNAGKSSLFNLLLNQNRAIVAPIPGTTRDYLTEWIDLEGIAVSLTDTAGLRKATGIIEKAGQRSAQEIMAGSDLVIWIVDLTRRSWEQELETDLKSISKTIILLLYNKIDKLNKAQKEKLEVKLKEHSGVVFSCVTRAGLKDLRTELVRRISNQMPDLTDRLVVTSERHKKKMENALKYLRKAKRNIGRDESPELVAFELRQGINEIDEITGRVYNEEILDRIFSRFCIGK
ncbi:MAG: tRNA uridine-5-carboxymethylaminomethyl(34) synthesis GTPase MnmE [candidate division Zixibacteria bacterium]|nr:tRNA uridine-5-carboxymethylaminomethyl(34) synthesis GTPase MnmE [candidate division Zixibacteria bacterium]